MTSQPTTMAVIPTAELVLATAAEDAAAAADIGGARFLEVRIL